MVLGDRCRSWQTHARKFKGARSMEWAKRLSLSHQYEPLSRCLKCGCSASRSNDEFASTRRACSVSGILSKKRPRSPFSAAEAAIVHAAWLYMSPMRADSKDQSSLLSCTMHLADISACGWDELITNPTVNQSTDTVFQACGP